jgi:hypothetical protein
MTERSCRSFLRRLSDDYESVPCQLLHHKLSVDAADVCYKRLADDFHAVHEISHLLEKLFLSELELRLLLEQRRNTPEPQVFFANYRRNGNGKRL